MPLDPFFDERLRVHRKYLFDQALGSMRTRLVTLGRFWRNPALPSPAAAGASVDVAPSSEAKTEATTGNAVRIADVQDACVDLLERGK